MMKKGISILLILTLCFGAMQSFAFEEKQAGEHTQTVMPVVEAESPLVSHEVLSELQDTQDYSKMGGVPFDESSVVDYSYQLTYYQDTPELVGVALAFSVMSEEEIYTFDLSGDVSKVKAENDNLLTGSLYKNFVIDGITYNFAVGFRKLESSDEISVGLVMTPLGEQYQNFYSFGKLTLTQEIYDEFQAIVATDSVNATTQSLFIASEVDDEDGLYFEYVGENSGYLISTAPLKDTMIGRTGSTMKVYKEDAVGRFMVLVNSQCASFTSSSFKNESNQLLGAYVNAFKVGLIKTSPEGRISGFEDIPMIEYSDKTKILRGGSHSYIHIKNLGTQAELNLDEGMPIVFQITRGLDTGLFEGKVYVEMTYLIETEYAAFYVRTTRADCDVSMAL